MSLSLSAFAASAWASRSPSRSCWPPLLTRGLAAPLVAAGPLPRSPPPLPVGAPPPLQVPPLARQVLPSLEAVVGESVLAVAVRLAKAAKLRLAKAVGVCLAKAVGVRLVQAVGLRRLEAGVLVLRLAHVRFQRCQCHGHGHGQAPAKHSQLDDKTISKQFQYKT